MQKTNMQIAEQNTLKAWLYALLVALGGALIYGALVSLTGDIYFYILFIFPLCAMYLFFKYNRKQLVLGTIIIAIVSLVLNILALFIGGTIYCCTEAEMIFSETFPIIVELEFGEGISDTILTAVFTLIGSVVGLVYGIYLQKQIKAQQVAGQEQVEQVKSEQVKSEQVEKEQTETKTVEQEKQNEEDANSIINRIKSKKNNE